MRPIRARGPVNVAGSNAPLAEEKINQLEVLVDEMIRANPEEARIRSCMKSIGIRYCKDPIDRMNRVLTELNGLRNSDHDLESEP